MTKTEKTQLLTLITDLAQRVARNYMLEDDDEPFIAIEGGTHYEAYYDTALNKIVLRPSKIWTDNVAHELAHWVQFTLTGETQCRSTPVAKRNHALIADHDRIQKDITAIMAHYHYTTAINRILG